MDEDGAGPRTMRTGTRLGPYRVGERIGVGGMGEVWAATHVRLHRSVAIKVIRAEALDADETRRARVIERFEREARATAALTSPHTVQIFDLGRTPDGGFFYAMERLDGFTLRSLVEEEGPVHPARVVHVLRQVCDSLGEAHDRGLIHRDIKPSNLFLCRRGVRHDFAKVLDFGLVREIDSGPQLTPADVLIGSPAFMPPELIRGVACLDARSDVYAVGCVAYWMLTGQLVFDHDHVLRVALAHAHEAPARPSRRAEVQIPEALEALVMRCLEKDPAARPASARELLAALDACAVEPAWTEEEASRWWHFHHGHPTGRISLVAAEGGAPAEAAPGRLLVVDDEPAVRLVLSRLLTQSGYEVLPAGSGREALDLIGRHEVDVVLTDLRMPGMSGLELVGEVHERAPELPVIVLTAHGTIPTAVEAIRAGARDFVMKPFDRDALCLVIEKVRRAVT